MDEFRWIVSTLVGIQLVVIGAVWRLILFHMRECATRNELRSEQLGKIAANIERIKEDVGDHEHGIRGQLHAYSQVLTRHEMDIERLKLRR